MDTIISFLRQLEANNNKPWFDAHKGEYMEARANFNAIVEKLIHGISEFDPTVRGVGIKECTYRIHKDMRFSKDGLPYKTHFGAFVARGGKKSGYSGYYFHIGTGSGEIYPCRSFLAVGNYYMEPKVLKILREDIELGGGDFDRIIKGLDPSLSLIRIRNLSALLSALIPMGHISNTSSSRISACQEHMMIPAWISIWFSRCSRPPSPSWTISIEP
jgi:uncharacterized protein (TIGR02453 family)